MSKAFTKEDDAEPERVTRSRSASGLPPGTVNYMTADGAKRIAEEMEKLRDLNPERAAEMERILSSARIVEAAVTPPNEVLFGTTVELLDADNRSRMLRIVGVDEIDFHSTYVSWFSPTGRSLLGSEVGQRVKLKVEGEIKAFTIARIIP